MKQKGKKPHFTPISPLYWEVSGNHTPRREPDLLGDAHTQIPQQGVCSVIFPPNSSPMLLPTLRVARVRGVFGFVILPFVLSLSHRGAPGSPAREGTRFTDAHGRLKGAKELTKQKQQQLESQLHIGNRIQKLLKRRLNC